jgi:hypothetical protein
MRKNVSGQKIGAQLVSATDGSAFTGSVTVSVTGDAGTQATGSVGSGACAHEGNGYHTYAPAQAETNYDLIAFTFTGTGAVPATVQVFTRDAATMPVNVTQWSGSAVATPSVAGVPEIDLTHVNGLAATLDSGLTAASIADAVWDELASGHTTGGTFGKAAADILDDTGTSGVKIASGTQTFNMTGSITGSLSGSVGSVSGAVGSVTGAVGSVTGNVGGNVTGSVGSLATQAKADVNAEVDTALADYDAPTNAELTTAVDALPTAAENAAALLDLTDGIETSITPRQALRAMLASVAGVLSGASEGSTEVTIKNPSGGTTRLTVTVDEDGNRSAVVTNL